MEKHDLQLEKKCESCGSDFLLPAQPGPRAIALAAAERRGSMLCPNCSARARGVKYRATERGKKTAIKATNKWRAHNAPKTANHKLLYKYGIDLDEYHRLLHNQGGTCAICREGNTLNRALAVDHDHKTGSVRGLLCHRCNTGIGQLRDNREILQRAIDYLNAHS